MRRCGGACRSVPYLIALESLSHFRKCESRWSRPGRAGAETMGRRGIPLIRSRQPNCVGPRRFQRETPAASPAPGGAGGWRGRADTDDETSWTQTLGSVEKHYEHYGKQHIVLNCDSANTRISSINGVPLDGFRNADAHKNLLAGISIAFRKRSSPPSRF